jgi:ABC-type branched-subunit amino acid transport system substrate-binding protein
MFYKHKYILSLILTTFLVSCSTFSNKEESKANEIYKSPDERATLEVIQEKNTTLISNSKRAKVALIIPISGNDAKVGKNIFDAAQQALFDLKANNMQVIPIDSSQPTALALKQLEEEKPEIILGPVFAKDVEKFYPYAHKHNLCMISFSNDRNLANRECLMIMGVMPEAALNKIIEFANSRGFSDIRTLLPQNNYGQTIGKHLSHTKNYYYWSQDSIVKKSDIANAIDKPGNNTALVISEGGKALANIAAEVQEKQGAIKLLGGNLWEDEKAFSNPALKGAWFASLPNEKKQIFELKFAKNFGYKPLKIASLGYDSIALVSALINSKADFSKAALTDPTGFMGITGAFRFKSDGSNERLLSVYEINNNVAVEIAKAATNF